MSTSTIVVALNAQLLRGLDLRPLKVGAHDDGSGWDGSRLPSATTSGAVGTRQGPG